MEYKMFKNVGTKLAASVLAFVNTILFTRIIGAEFNGLFSIIVAQVTLATTLSNLGTDTTFNYLIAANKINIKTAFINWLIFGLLQITLIAFIYNGYAHLVHDEITTHKKIFIAYCAFAIFNATLSGLVNGLQQFSRVNWANLAMQILSLIIWIYVYLNPIIDKPNAIYLFVCLQAIPALLLLLYLIIKKIPGHTFQFLNSHLLKLIFTYSLMVLLTNFVQQLALQINLLQLKHYFASNYLTDAGLLGNALKLIQLLWIVPMAISGISFSIIAQQGMRSFKIHSAKNRIVFQLLCLFSILLFVTAPVFIPLLFGNQFLNSIPLFRILLIGASLFLIPVIIAPFFSGNNLIKYNLYASGLCLLVAVILGLLLIPNYKALGAAIALSTGLGAAAILNMYHYAKFSNTSMWYFLQPQLISPQKILALLRD